VLGTQKQVESLAARIERAYSLRRPSWHGGCSSPRVWETAAQALLQMHRDDPTLPVDPELFVAAQSFQGSTADPWTELTSEKSARRYRRRVRLIIRGLRDELRSEVRLAERRVRRGEAIESVLMTEGSALSPLGCFIAAQRAGRGDLVERYRNEAEAQHRSCPLYQQASLRLLSPDSSRAKLGRNEGPPSSARLTAHRV